MTLIELAKRVRLGVKLLDKKIPNWRRTIRDHRDEFDFADGSCCVLGTLEHYNGRMKALKARKSVFTDYSYEAAEQALGIEGSEYGFDGLSTFRQAAGEGDYDYDVEVLDALWRAEIGL